MTGYLLIWILLCPSCLLGQLLPKELDYQVVKIQQELLRSFRHPIVSLTQSMVENQLNGCNNTINALETKIVEMEKRVTELEARSQDVKVGFYTFITYASAEAIIKFDRVKFNEGQAYDSSTGVFTCPISGAYHFVWSVQVDNTEYGYVLVDFKRNGDTYGFTITHGPKQHTSTNSVVIRLQRGDRIWLQKRLMALIKIADYETSFSGHFLYH
ncbi:complement C1q and tumor necrosis factor-related protein 9B-like [Ylistrum balloti]|uniref:complement C1q and tumor necrosis factor-related protein 9B-like n=1 Tax=Ylistrum balloti TaxID=509963 RepID=UPI002905AEB5|nr:complement C1q and tumor necrosis factor-related protein 9B-like [Ylistrum balloti]